MLIACPTCHRQYDVGSRKPGAKVRCFCGELCRVPREQARQVKMLHCSHCGGRLVDGATICEFCEAEVALGDRGLGEACPECFSRLVKGADFCSTCGVGIDPQVLRALTSMSCPRCDGEMALCERPGGSFTECTMCGGIWLSEKSFEDLSTRRETRSVMGFLPSGKDQPPPPPLLREKVKYMKCPECGDLMNRKNFAVCSGVVIDWCRGHGYWFDTHELEHIVRFIDDGGLDRARERKLERQKSTLQRESIRAENAAKSLRLADRSRGSSRFDTGFSLLWLLAAVINIFTD